jgi:hypothetical protein
MPAERWVRLRELETCAPRGGKSRAGPARRGHGLSDQLHTWRYSPCSFNYHDARRPQWWRSLLRVRLPQGWRA